MKQNPLKDKLPEFEAIIFDMDGTLVDSMWMWGEIDKEYLGGLGIELPEDLQEKIEGMSFSETAVYIKERFGLSDSLDTMKQTWVEMACEKYRHEVPYKEGAREFLEMCRSRGVKMGVATSNSRELVEHAAQALSFYDYISCIITACEVKRGKPAPDVYLAVAEKLGIAPKKCLVFEDITAGIQAGKAAGMTVCAVEDEYSAGNRRRKQELADYYIDNYLELI